MTKINLVDRNFIVKYPFLFVIVLTLVNCKSDKHNRHNNQEGVNDDDKIDIEEQITNWWKTMEETNHIKCKLSKDETSTKSFNANNFASAPEISTIPCKRSKTLIQKHFRIINNRMLRLI